MLLGFHGSCSNTRKPYVVPRVLLASHAPSLLRDQELDLSCNLLDQLPAPMCCSLSSLDFLSLAGNALTCLPPEVDRLGRLTWLDVSDNRLAALPACMATMASLQVGRSGEGRAGPF